MKKQKGKLLQVAHLGHPILRKKSKEISDTKNFEIQTLIDDLIATVLEVDGVGISAPQVYQSIRIFILASHPNPRYPHAPKMKPAAIINPKVLDMSKRKIKDWEGCLSIPELRGLIPRSKSVDVEFMTRDGKKVRKTFTDFVARIFQHEYDHLEGKLFIDRVESSLDLISEKEFQKIIKKSKK
ncbi:peptide deformylase [Candidatus Roizmanbacteria bacterium RIFCSPLOWO2_01_FULL_38_12]|uniref:Peptide deformylase n=1 Tax=Candidatus Roizmanbacteria bacterium RIFCSPLOWO2_01_FULL_38_12 TaxID=1802061 RepID=A0A1F7IRA8_9BACT|nr:MAG: peptide deformylase [Candidatus Roizmanbacteria bacterium RIFCSPHIGHO2_01_FULL_38_15]OGK35408.1 MAG: peptide deformylase [Candidatus Roizmanbacteria bacterium RIFCSPHIGHO2_12_FULL_38_13]OGK45884.1 MAG: peptide deformylase [Candidatus Roizmanbacteria bacterium RIFCSPLOWO2_01_FULL_38_12]